jgi:pimeloyl-ACP methyl ester carboxylesterase
VAVLRAAGEESAYVFGNSSGAVVALDMAKTQPQAVRAVVAHKPPVPRMHPKAKKWQRFFAACYMSSFRLGSYYTALKFMFGVQLPVQKLGRAQAQAGEYAKSHRE